MRAAIAKAVLMWWLGLAGTVAAGASDAVSAGETHFQEFKATCLDTKGHLSAIEQHAKGQGWARGFIRTHTTGGTTAGWTFTKEGRFFSVLVQADFPMPWGNEDVKGKPFSSCVVSAAENADGGAVRRMRELLKAAGCEGNPNAPGSHVRWPMGGEGFKVIYYFNRERDPEGTRDVLSLERLGTELADLALAGPHVPAACAPP